MPAWGTSSILTPTPLPKLKSIRPIRDATLFRKYWRK